MIKKHRLFVGTTLLIALLASSACTPLITTGTAPDETVILVPTPESETAEAAAEAATATVNVRSLRVRSQPAENGEVLGGIREGEKYQVLGISSDGLWVQLAIEGITGGNGWVSANFVNVEGPITDAVTTQVPTAAPTTPTIATTDTTTATATATTIMTATVAISPTITATSLTTATTIALSPTITPTVEATPAPGFALVRSGGIRLRVRGEANADSPIVGYVYDGESYEALEISADGQWVRIDGSDGSNPDNPNGGWVAAQYVVIGQ